MSLAAHLFLQTSKAQDVYWKVYIRNNELNITIKFMTENWLVFRFVFYLETTGHKAPNQNDTYILATSIKISGWSTEVIHVPFAGKNALGDGLICFLCKICHILRIILFPWPFDLWWPWRFSNQFVSTIQESQLPWLCLW